VLAHVILILSFVAAIGCGLVAGIFLAFSSFVMAALGRLPSDHGIAAMNAINVTVINPVFFLAFFGTGVVCLLAVVGSVLRWSTASGALVVIAAVVYIAGCIAVTMLRNVPLNNALAAVTLGTPEAAALWARFLGEWTLWNTVRTVASAVSAVLFTSALLTAS
jgi:uncharacterized membrane protein